MEYELFRSKLKPSIDGALIPGMIRGSSSGLNSHRTAAMELIIEGSIQERRERMFEKAKKNLRPDPIPQPKRTSEARNISIPEVQPSVPPPAPQPPSQSLPNGTTETVTSPKPASSKYKASEDSWAFSGYVKNIRKAVQHEEPPADVKTNPSSLDDFVELVCRVCSARQLRSRLWDGVYCSPCPLLVKMRCVGCDTIRVDDVRACTGCHRVFK